MSLVTSSKDGVKQQFANNYQQNEFTKEDINLTPSDSVVDQSFYARYETLYHVSSRFRQMQQLRREMSLGIYAPQSYKYAQAQQKPGFKRPAIVLDLDQCLLYSQYQSQDQTFGQKELAFSAPTYYKEGIVTVYRKHLIPFLKFLTRHFEVIVWSAGIHDYVAQRLKHFGILKYVSAMLSRENCTYANGVYLKDLSILVNDRRPLDNILILDDNCDSCLLNIRNSIPVVPFQGQDDDELLYIQQILEKICSYNLPMVEALQKYIQEEKKQDQFIDVASLNFNKQQCQI